VGKTHGFNKRLFLFVFVIPVQSGWINTKASLPPQHNGGKNTDFLQKIRRRSSAVAGAV